MSEIEEKIKASIVGIFALGFFWFIYPVFGIPASLMATGLVGIVLYLAVYNPSSIF